jgi:hypothetical protein
MYVNYHEGVTFLISASIKSHIHLNEWNVNTLLLHVLKDEFLVDRKYEHLIIIHFKLSDTF